MRKKSQGRRFATDRTSIFTISSVETLGETSLPPGSGANMSVVEQLRGLARLLAPKEVARILQVHQETIYTMMKEGALPNIRVGRARRIDSVLLAAWLEERSS